MRPVDALLDEYGESHRHRLNKLIHWVCVPAIMFSVLGLLWSLSVPDVLARAPFLNWAVLCVVLAMVYYLLVSVRLALGILVVAALMLAVLSWLARTGLSIWLTSAAIFALAWAVQFIGHHVEGRRPSFLKDVQFLLIGPLWLLAHLYRKLGIRY